VVGAFDALCVRPMRAVHWAAQTDYATLNAVIRKRLPLNYHHGQTNARTTGCERGTLHPNLLPPERAQTLQELVAALQGLSPALGSGNGSGGSSSAHGASGSSSGLPLCWLGGYDPSAAASCRITPGGGPAAARAAPAGGVGAAGAAECNAGGQMLQSFLDGLGSLNTFG